MNCLRITESGAGLQILNGIECLQDLHPNTYQPIDFLIEVFPEEPIPIYL